jgi:HTH-type transcriptional regulator / antitoxin HigA
MDTENITIKPIKTTEEYQLALKQIDTLWEAPPKSAGADILEVLSILVDDYENKHFPIDAPDPIEAIKYQMEQLHLSQQDLAKYLGGKSRVSEILHKKRPLTLKMIKALHQQLHIPLSVLVGH